MNCRVGNALLPTIILRYKWWAEKRCPPYRAVFADTLPDDFGNAVIDAWLARKGRDSHSFSPLERYLL